MTQGLLILFIAILFVLLIVVFFLFFNRPRKHWLKNRAGDGLPGLDIVVCEIEDTTFNKFKTAADGSFVFSFRPGWSNISIVEPALGVKEIVDHPETTINNQGDATFNIQKMRESVIFIVGPIGHLRKKRKSKNK